MSLVISPRDCYSTARNIFQAVPLIHENLHENLLRKGKKVANLDIIKVSFNLAAITELTHEFKGEQYLSFEVAKMKEPDQFENTHTVYVNKLVEEEASTVAEPTTPSKKSLKTKKAANPAPKPDPTDEIPF